MPGFTLPEPSDPRGDGFSDLPGLACSDARTKAPQSQRDPERNAPRPGAGAVVRDPRGAERR